MIRGKKSLLLVMFFGVFVSLFGETEQTTTYMTEVFASTSSGIYTPFWMVNNQWGMVPLHANNAYLRGGVFHDKSMNRDWSYAVGLDLTFSTLHAYQHVWFQQLFGELQWKQIRLNIGSKEDYVSFMDKNLSSGDLINSMNARPVPEIKISVIDFISVPKTNHLLYLKFDFGLGKFLDGNYQEKTAIPFDGEYVKNTLLHHKSLYFRIGNIEKYHPIQFTFGLDHHVQWGGSIYRKGFDQPFKMALSFNSLIRAIFAKGGSSNAIFTDNYISGNHLGSFLLKLDFNLLKNEELSIYLNHFFEDESGLRWDNYRDMLLGVLYKSHTSSLLSGALFEYMYTKDQSGPVHFNQFLKESHIHLNKYGFGMDNYFNHFDYVQGWSYYGRAIGNPLTLSPEYNKDGFTGFKGTRIIACHTGIEGDFSSHLSYRFLFSYGKNWGRHYVPYITPKTGTATALFLTYRVPSIKGLFLKGCFAFNRGDFFGENAFGLSFSVVKGGLLHFKK